VETSDLDVMLHPQDSNRDDFAWSRRPMPEHSEYKWVKYKDDLERSEMIPELKDLVMKEMIDRDDAKSFKPTQYKMPNLSLD
jgi:hypothetical protein